MFILFGLVELSFVVILRNSKMSYYCLQHHLMNTAQLLTVHPTTTNRPTTVYQLICTRCTLLAESLRSSRLIQEDRRRLQEDRRRLCQQGTPDVDNLNNLNVGTFGLPDHENYKRFSQQTKCNKQTYKLNNFKHERTHVSVTAKPTKLQLRAKQEL